MAAISTRDRKLRPSNASRMTEVSRVTAKEFKRQFETIAENIGRVIKGKDDVIRLSLSAILAEGNILFEDLPGTGKSMLARAIAQSISASVSRVQCTPDMLPGDITGSTIYDQRRGTFDFRAGPIFCNILLADEINRATPKTQSALLEAMMERMVTVDGTSHALPRPFLVLATQNPVEQAGTFPLPEAQLDRFLFKLQMGYPGRDAEIQVMFENAVQLRIEDLGAVTDTNEVSKMIGYAASKVEVSADVAGYIVDLIRASREDPALSVGASPRASIALLRASRVLAATDGREHVYPDDIRHILRPVMAHRVILSPEAILRGETVEGVLERMTTRVKPPSGGARSTVSLDTVS